MAEQSDAFEILALCAENKRTTALASATAARTVVGMLVVAVFDSPIQRRLELLMREPQGPELATEVVLIGIERNDLEDRVTKLAYEVIPKLGARLVLGIDQATRALDRLSDEDPVEPGNGATVLAWTAHWQRAAALSYCRAHIVKTEAGSLDALDTMAAQLLGASTDSGDHASLLDYAQRNIDAEHHGPHDQLVGHLTTLTDADLNQLLPQLPAYAAHGWGPGKHLISTFTGLTLDQIRTVGDAVANGELQEAWFTSHVLPHLFSAQAPNLADTLDESWWPGPSLDWVLTTAPWAEHEPPALPRMLRSVKRLEDPALTAQAHAMIRRETEAAEPDHATKSALPRLGARTLLSEALAGSLPTTSNELRQALAHLDRNLRLHEYRDASWAQVSRAERMAQVVATVDVDEVTDIASHVLSLKHKARDAFLSTIAPQLTPEAATRLAAAAGDDEAALNALTAGSPGEDAVKARWDNSRHFPSFRALAGSSHRTTRLAAVPDLVRDYDNGLDAARRNELLTALEPSEDRHKLLLDILSDWGSHPGPDDTTLVHVLELTAHHLSSGADPDAFAEVAKPLCNRHNGLRVRRAVYTALAVARPTAPVSALLHERASNEPQAGQRAVTEAIDAVTAKLIALADSGDPRDAVTAVEMLERLRPEEAVPIARQLVRSAHDKADRIRAIHIVAHHGDRASDPELLRELTEGDTAHPDAAVRTEALRALRRLEIGDLQAAHERIGQLAGIDPTRWDALDPTPLYGAWGDALREGLDRVAEAETAENWRDGIDQLNEVAKVLLYRALELAGPAEEVSGGLIKKAGDRDRNYGSVVGAQSLSQKWPWVTFFAALHQKRAAHITEPGSTTPPPRRDRPDYDSALVSFRDGAGPCCDLIARHTP